MSVHSVTLADCLHQVEPPETVLRVGAIGDTAFVYIEKYEDNSKGSTTTIVAEIAVSLPALREALQLLRHDVEREDIRPLDPPGNERGEFGAKLTGARLSVLPL